MRQVGHRRCAKRAIPLLSRFEEFAEGEDEADVP